MAVILIQKSIDKDIEKVIIFSKNDIVNMEIQYISSNIASDKKQDIRNAQLIFESDGPFLNFEVNCDENSTSVFIRGNIYNAINAMQKRAILNNQIIQLIQNNEDNKDLIEKSKKYVDKDSLDVDTNNQYSPSFFGSQNNDLYSELFSANIQITDNKVKDQIKVAIEDVSQKMAELAAILYNANPTINSNDIFQKLAEKASKNMENKSKQIISKPLSSQ
jgi:hypothetical protein